MRMLTAVVVTAAVVAVGAAVVIVVTNRTDEASGGCVDAIGDTYEFHDNGVFEPGSTLSDPTLRDPEGYVSWTVPISPVEGSDITSIELVRDDEGLTVTAELADSWIPFANLGDPDSTWAPGDPLAGSTVTVWMSRDGWAGMVVIEDSAADTTFSAGPSGVAPDDRSKTTLDAPTFDGRRATVHIPSEAIHELGESFKFSAWSSLVTNDNVGILDNCPDLRPSAPTDPATPSVEFPNDKASGATADAVSNTRPSLLASTTTTAMTPPSSLPTPTTAPTPQVPGSPECPQSWTGPVSDLDLVAQCLYRAYSDGDREWAALFADQQAVDKLFESPWEPPEWQFTGCEENADVPPYGTCYFTIAGEPHGVQIEMVMDGGASAGITVFAVEFYG